VKTPQQILKKYWGYSDFRQPQKEIIDSVLSKNDTFAILPTGGGKSLCYQIPAIAFEGMTLVISPLIALMQDQIQALIKVGINAASITSQLDFEEINEVLNQCRLGKIKLLYIAPERLQSQLFINSLNELNIDLIAIDEAHCISQWGHDFRPAYLRISDIREILPKAPILALTATAIPKVQEEIISSLKLKNVRVFKTTLKRNNLIHKVKTTQNELDDLYYELKRNPGSSIVFVRTRRQTYEIAQFLTEKGLNADFFHARLPDEEKKAKQEIWTKSDHQIMVSTNAFGMGIDKSNVRSIIHMDLPNSLEAYVQEAGRAGRDGLRSEAVLFLQTNAIEKIENIFKSNLPTRDEYEKIHRLFYTYLNIGENEKPEDKKEFVFFEFIQKFDLNKRKVHNVLSFLERKEVISIEENANLSRVQVYINPKSFINKQSIQLQILEILVRKYPGILSQEMPISEFKIAKALQKSVKEIKVALNELNKKEYIHYQSYDVKNIYFLRPRESNHIKNTLWKEFKELQLTQWKRIQDMIYYASQTEICRERLILKYFGEKAKQNCSVCDVCLKNKVEINPKEILNFLNDSPKDLSTITLEFIQFPKAKVLETLEYLANEELIESVGINTYVRKKLSK